MQDVAGWTLHLHPGLSSKITNCDVGTGTGAAKGPILCELLDERLMSCSKMDVSEWMRINPASTATYAAQGATQQATQQVALPILSTRTDCHSMSLPHLLGASLPHLLGAD